jgi:WXG100 family type VII secretion target
MAAGKLRIEYNVLGNLSSKFQGEAHDIQQMYQALKNHTEHLRGSGWIGRAADQWFNEMENILLPKTQMLGQILDGIGNLLKQLNSIFQAAEQEVGSLFKRAR